MRSLLFWATLFCCFALSACGGSAPPPATPTLSTTQQLGAQVYTRHCAACHLLTPDDVKVGPSLHGIADRAATRVPNQDAKAYIMMSVINPSDYVVSEFEDLMPKTLAKSLTGEELDAVVDYLLTLQQ